MRDRPPIAIALLTAEDVESCAEIMTHSLPWLRYGVTESTARALWREALTQGAMVAVARIAARAAGFAWYIEGGAFGRSGYLKLLGVDAHTRGRGVGRALLAHTEALARAHGEQDLFLLVSDFNLPAQQFYRAAGYRQVGALTDYVQQGITELVYCRSLEKEVEA